MWKKSKILAISRLISGRLVSAISKIDPKEANIPNIAIMPKFEFAIAMRRHHWATLIKFLPTRSSLSEAPWRSKLGRYRLHNPQYR